MVFEGHLFDNPNTARKMAREFSETTGRPATVRKAKGFGEKGIRVSPYWIVIDDNTKKYVDYIIDDSGEVKQVKVGKLRKLL